MGGWLGREMGGYVDSVPMSTLVMAVHKDIERKNKDISEKS
jgi:hypothetical protein